MEIEYLKGVEEFISSLEKKTIAKALRTIDLLEKFGSKLGMPHSKKVKTGLYELRIRGQQEARIFYCYHQSKIILLSAFIKKSRKTPDKELEKAERRMESLT